MICFFMYGYLLPLLLLIVSFNSVMLHKLWNQVSVVGRGGLICFFVSGYLLPFLLLVGLFSVMLHMLWNQVSVVAEGEG